MDFISAHKRKFFIFMVFLLIATAIITGTHRYNPKFLKSVLGFIVVPVQNATSGIVESISSRFKKSSDIDKLNAENAELKEQIATLIDENKRLELFETENMELSSLLKINRKYPDYEKLGVQIVSKDTSNWYNVFTIDRGSNDGITEDMFVVAEGGLVGRIFDVSAGYSKIMAIIDDRSAVHVQSRQSDDIGVVKGDTALMQQGLCTMESISLDAEISVNDEIITSVFSEIPAGITIGYVKEITASAEGLTKSAVITPSVDLKNLNKAIVLLKKIEE